MVRRGEQAIWILAPVTRRVSVERDTDTTEATRRLVTAFRPLPVFDVGQTDGDPLPDVWNRLTGDPPGGAYSALVTVAESIGFTVADRVFDGETNGDCSHALRRTRVEVNLNPSRLRPAERCALCGVSAL